MCWKWEGGIGGFGWDPPPPRVPLWSPAKGGPNILKPKSSWHRRRRSRIGAVSLKHWKGRRRGGVPPLLLRCMAGLIHHQGPSVVIATPTPSVKLQPLCPAIGCDSPRMPKRLTSPPSGISACGNRPADRALAPHCAPRAEQQTKPWSSTRAVLVLWVQCGGTGTIAEPRPLVTRPKTSLTQSDPEYFTKTQRVLQSVRGRYRGGGGGYESTNSGETKSVPFLKMSEHIMFGSQQLLMRNSGRLLLFLGGLWFSIIAVIPGGLWMVSCPVWTAKGACRN